MVYRIAVLDDETAELKKTKEMLLLYAKEHPENELEISCFAETATFMEAVSCGQENWESVRRLRQKGYRKTQS